MGESFRPHTSRAKRLLLSPFTVLIQNSKTLVTRIDCIDKLVNSFPRLTYYRVDILSEFSRRSVE